MAKKERLEYIECQQVTGVGYCSDNECPCTVTPIEPGTGYLYISPEVVDFRRDTLSQAAVKEKLAPAIERGENISISAYEPILVCEQAAKRRNLDLAIAAEDARMWWEMHRVPLRPTPCATDSAYPEPRAEPEPASDPVLMQEPVVLDNQVSADSQSSFGYVPGEIRDVSTDDIVAQYAGTPLEEMAARMANEEQTAAKGDYATTDTAIPAAFAKIKTEPGITGDYSAPVPRHADEKRGNGKKIALISVLSALALFSIMSVAMLFLSLKSKPSRAQAKPGAPVTNQEEGRSAALDEEFSDADFEKVETPADPGDSGVASRITAAPPETVAPAVSVPDAPEAAAEPEQQPVSENPALSPGFFKTGYAFKDARYTGTIRFITLTGQKGNYLQDVSPVGKDKVYHVTGTFTWEQGSIFFKPDGAKVVVTWKLASMDQSTGSAVFFDPEKGNTVESRVYLEPEGKQ